METIFHKMAKGEVRPDTVVYEDDDVLAFRDIHPVAPVHIVIIPKKAITSLADIKPEDQMLLGKMLLIIKTLAEEEGIAESGYRVVTNSGKEGGQEVVHLHFHLIGGKRLGSKIG